MLGGKRGGNLLRCGALGRLVLGRDAYLFRRRLLRRRRRLRRQLVLGETGSALTLRTTTEPVVVPKADIARRETSDRSLMPEGLLESLSDRERIELLKYLTEN